MAVTLRKWLGIGKLPDEFRAELTPERIIHLSEFVPITLRFTGSVPGRRSVGLKRGYVGALVLTDHRVLGTLSTVPKKAGRAIDLTWDAPPTGAVHATLSETGLHLEIADLARIDPAFEGRMSLTYKQPLADDVLTQLHTRAVTYDVPARFVTSVLGVRT